MGVPAPTVVWLRNDLRIGDNPALTEAAARGPVVPLYILDRSDATRPMGAASRWWLDKSLRDLGDSLAARGAPLTLRSGRPMDVLDELIDETGAGAVYWNRLYDRDHIARDEAIKTGLKSRGLEVKSFNGALLLEPWDLKTGAGGPYRVFTPFWRAARPLADAAGMVREPERLLPPARSPRSERIERWRLHPTKPDWSGGFADWRPGEAGAQARLTAFIEDAAAQYGARRNTPGTRGTSRLSPHLHFGEISPRQVWSATRALAIAGSVPDDQVDAFQRELGWREFNHHLIFHFPNMDREGFNAKFDAFPWRTDPVAMTAWTAGRTGYPIVDAGMRELWTTGWMHNRVRMIVASFLIKDLLIDWREGEAWFWDTLVDADLANNVAGWQWVAGCGADAAPYFRVFNPVLQGEKFDPRGEYVRRWIPELARLPNACIHQPWRADKGLLAEAGVRLGDTYPAPIVDHAEARDRALAAYERLS